MVWTANDFSIRRSRISRKAQLNDQSTKESVSMKVRGECLVYQSLRSSETIVMMVTALEIAVLKKAH